MNLKSLSDAELLTGVRNLRSEERRLDRRILEFILEIESRRLFAEIGYPSVIEWLIKDLGYSEASAYRRVMAARAIKVVPEASAKIESGSLNLVALAKVQSAIRYEEKRTGETVAVATRAELILKTENKTLRETEKLIAAQFPNGSHQFKGTQVCLTDDQVIDLERVRDLMSHSNFGASLGEIVAALVQNYLDRHDPLRREVKSRKPIAANANKGSTQCAATVESPRTTKRKPLSPFTRNHVKRRAGDACEFVAADGRRCGSRFQTQIDHKEPVAQGGSDSIDNLQVLCRTHNLLMAERILRPERVLGARKSRCY